MKAFIVQLVGCAGNTPVAVIPGDNHPDRPTRDHVLDVVKHHIDTTWIPGESNLAVSQPDDDTFVINVEFEGMQDEDYYVAEVVEMDGWEGYTID
jgi:hypothetical protein